MKCPRCDTDISDNKKCSKCGLDVEGSHQELEVEYKDFKTSELLEIRQKKQTVQENEEIRTAREQQGEKALKRESSVDKNDKKPFSFLAAITLILLLIAGVFFIFRYFKMQ